MYNFDTPGGTNPYAGLIADAAGNLYGDTFFGGANGLGAVFKLTRTSGGVWTGTTIHDFENNGSDGANPEDGLILDASGHLYGTTTAGGANGEGIVFEIVP